VWTLFLCTSNQVDHFEGWRPERMNVREHDGSASQPIPDPYFPIGSSRANQSVSHSLFVFVV
jgi:hypothetical protein